jgi:hypothetical protein
MTTPTQVIDVTSDAGKNFVKNVEKLKQELKINGKGDKLRQQRELSEKQILDNSFLRDFMTIDLFKNFEISKVAIGQFGRKGGYNYNPISENNFRFFIHLGDPEVYYVSDETAKDRLVPLTNGQGFIVSSLSAPQTEVTVYSDPIRIIYDPNIQSKIPKIRPRNYSRTTLVYDLIYNISNELLEEGEEIFNELQDAESVNRVASTETVPEVMPTETVSEVMPTETVNEVMPTETVNEVMPTETVNEVMPTETVNEVMPTETVAEIMQCNSCEDLCKRKKHEMEEFTEWLSNMKFIIVKQNGHNYFRCTKDEEDPLCHDCPGFSEFDEKYCPGCRGCIYTTYDVIHTFLTYLILQGWTDDQLKKYFQLDYVNVKKHRNMFPGGCHIHLYGEKNICDYQKMFHLNHENTTKIITNFCI